MRINIAQIIPDPNQPRHEVDEKYIKELAASYGRAGPVQPPIVRCLSDHHYMLITGEQRWRAAKLLGYRWLECIVQPNMDDREVRRMQLVENIHHKKLNAVELAQAYIDFRKQEGLTQEELAQMIGKDKSTVDRYESLVSRLSCCNLQQLKAGMLKLSIAFELAKIRDKTKQDKVFEAMNKLGVMNIPQVVRIVAAINVASDDVNIENLVKQMRHPPKPSAEKEKRVPSSELASDKLIGRIVDFYQVLRTVNINHVPSNKKERLIGELNQVQCFTGQLLQELDGYTAVKAFTPSSEVNKFTRDKQKNRKTRSKENC